MNDDVSRKLFDFIDQQRELSGAGGAKQDRFFGDGEGSPRSQQEKERKRQAEAREFNRLMELIASDPAYAAARQEFGGFLGGVEQATETALLQAQNAYVDARRELSDLLDSANRLPDGRAVFRDPVTGNIYTEDDELVSPEDAASIVWKDGAPDYQDYISARRKADETRQRVEEIERYQRDVLGPARDRFDDEDDPMTPDEFDKHKKRIEDEMPPAVKSLSGAELSGQDRSLTPSAAIDVPTL